MDDLTTDGDSKLAFARGLRSAGAVVQHVLTIFYHDAFPGARERLSTAGLKIARARNLDPTSCRVLQASVASARARVD